MQARYLQECSLALDFLALPVAQEASDSGRRLLRLTDRQEGIVQAWLLSWEPAKSNHPKKILFAFHELSSGQVLTVDDPDGSCEQFGMPPDLQ